MKNETKVTPMVQQYHDIKSKYEDCILFFRLGDFYEMFFDDAVKASRALDLTLTARAGNPMCGVPYHACDTYIAKLISHGYKVAICEQLSEPTKNGKMVLRDVVRVITPGTVTDEVMLDRSKNNYIICVYFDGEKMGMSYGDISTGMFETEYVGSNFAQSLTDTLSRIMPSEVIGNDLAGEVYDALPIANTGSLPRLERYYNWAFRFERCDENLKKQFGENYQKVSELEGKKSSIISAGALIEYLSETQKRTLKAIKQIKLVKNSDYLQIDATARKNLELVETIRDRKRYGSLIWLLDKTKTSMGARKFRYIFDHPLQSEQKINERLDKVEEVYKKSVLRDEISSSLSPIGDIERLAGKIAYGSIMPKDLLSLKNSLRPLPTLKSVLSQSTTLAEANERIDDFSDLFELLSKAIKEDAPYLLRDGGYIKEGFNSELDDLRHAKTKADKWLQDLENEEKLKTGIKSLKIISNRVYGYFIEVNKKEAERVPLYYRRKQTVANTERYITEDLKIIENKILNASEKAVKLESVIFEQLKDHLQTLVDDLLATADAISDVDVINSLAQTAATFGYSRPELSSAIEKIDIVGGRHPVVEAFMKDGSFIANDTFLSSPEDQIMIITGPNMAGKSTYMRQVALITFMAHIGSFVPAKSAKIAITDRIFTRVGASDDLAFGQSTFMVEMSEVASILANATEKSLIILDEIGRGTSTFDGLSIAWAVVEHLSKTLPAKTLFATHYHELSDLEGNLSGVKNYQVLVRETGDEVVFLRRIARGGASKSFGIEVARMAGVPKEVIARAKEISRGLENLNTKLDLSLLEHVPQLQLENKTKDEIYRIIKDIDPNRLSPMQAFEILVELANKIKEEE